MRVAGPQPNMPQLRSTTRSNAPSVAGSNPRSTSIRRPPASTTATPLAPATAGGVAPAMSTATQRCAPAPPRSRCRRRFRYASSVETFSPRLSQNIRRLSPLAANSRANCSVSPGVRRRAALVSSLPIPPLKHHPRRSERWVGLTDTLQPPERSTKLSAAYVLLNFQEPIGIDVLEGLHGSARPADLDRGDPLFASQPEVHSFVARRHEPCANGYVVVEHAARAGRELHFRANRVAVARVAHQLQRQPVIAVAARVEEDAGPLHERCDDQILEAVVVEIADRRSALVTGAQEASAHLIGYVHELLPAQIAEHGVVLACVRQLVVDVAVGGVQVFPAVVVIVYEGGAPARERLAELFQMDLLGDIAKEIAAVAVELPDLPP